MHPRIAELFEFNDQQRSKLRSAVDAVPSERWNQAPAEGRWSVAQVIDHLGIIEARIAGLFQMKIAEARASGVGAETETSSILDSLNLSQIENRETKIAGPKSFAPASDATVDAAWSRLEESRRAFRAAVLEGDGLALGEIMHPHLAFGPFSLYKWIGFIGAHDARHADQIREIGEAFRAVPSN